MQTLRHVVTGTDFSAGAERALAVAATLAAALGVGLTVVHVCELDLDTDDSQRCSAALRALVERYRRAGLQVTGVLRSGRAWEKLDNVAADVGAGLIVTGRGRDDELGAVARQLLRFAHRPVLIVGSDFE
jgi:nucleotide-binding universal stress UspA family protein